MRKVYIIVEGQTEQEFINSVVAPYLRMKGISIVIPILIKTSKNGRGGFVNFQHLANTIKPLLANKKDYFIVTTFVDFFRVPTNCANYNECMFLDARISQVEQLEQSMSNFFNDRRFLPYIQLHEFEALLFSHPIGFEVFFETREKSLLMNVFEDYPNPEDINTTVNGAPSKRILNVKDNYNKVIDGNLIALEIGIHKIIERCNRFSSWLKNIEKMSH